MSISKDRIDLGRLGTRLLKGKVYIICGILVGLVWVVFLSLLAEKKSVYQKEILFKVETAEEVCPLRKADIEHCVYGQKEGERSQPRKPGRPGLLQNVMLMVTEPRESNRQLVNFKIFIRGRTSSEVELRAKKIEEELYNKITQKVLSCLTENIENMAESISRNKNNDDIVKSLEKQCIRLQHYRHVISEGRLSVLKKISQTQPELIWQIPDISFDLPSALMIGLATGIIMAVFCSNKKV